MSMSNGSTPRVNHVFVDFENVRRIDPEVVGKRSFSLQVFLGPQNKKLDVDVVQSLLEHSQMVKLVRSPKTGKNALDFVLAFELGQAVLTDPKGFFHIISKDEGFDSLVELLRERQVKVRRHPDWESLDAALAVKVEAPKPSSNGAKPELSEAAKKMLESLRKSPRNRPKQRKTLVSHAVQFAGKDAGVKAQEAVVRELEKAGWLSFDGAGKATYRV